MATSIPADRVDTVIFACEAGMGSSVMGANALKKKLGKAKLGVSVVHRSVRALPADAGVIVTHRGLAPLARQNAPAAVVIAFTHFLNDPVFDRLVEMLATGEDVTEIG